MDSLLELVVRMAHQQEMPNILPIQYTLELYEDNFDSTPVDVFNSSTPFMNFAVGDYVDPALWESLLTKQGTWYKVTDVVHRVWSIERSHIGHQVCIAIRCG